MDSLRKFAIYLLLLFSLLSCKKSKNEITSPNEPIVSNKLDTSLLAGTWKLASHSNYYAMYFGPDHRVMQDNRNFTGIWNITGYWSLINSNEINLSGSAFPVSAKIIKLTNDSLVFSYSNATYRHKRIETQNDPYAIKTIIGTGTPNGVTPDLPTPPLSVAISYVYDVIEDDLGNLYFTDMPNDRIRILDRTTNLVSTFLSITNPINIAFDRNKDMIISGDNKVMRYSFATKKITTLVSDQNLTEVAVDKNNDIYYIQNFTYTTQLKRIDHITGNSSIVTDFKYYPGTGKLTNVSSVRGLASDTDGNIYLATAGHVYFGNDEDSAVWKYTVDNNTVQLIVGTKLKLSEGDGEIATKASLDYPISLAIDKDNNIFIGDNNKIRKIDFKTQIISRIGGTLTTTTGSGDWLNATWADLSLIRGLMVNSKGEVIFSDSGQFRIRKLYLK